jgi:hypothetical protein
MNNENLKNNNMKKFKVYFLWACCLSLFVACSENDEINPITVGDYPVKEYALERDPNVNVWGAGMDFIHDEVMSTETELDYTYLEETDDFPYDIKFYTVKAYYLNSKGEIAAEGCPAMLLNSTVKACKIGEGVTFFDTCSVITPEMQLAVVPEPVVDYEACKNDTGYYDRDKLLAAIDQCVIGRSFRSNVLEVPEGKTEQEVQAVYLVKTNEGGYAKFMVKQFKGDKPNEKQTIVRWQVISE